MEAHKPDRRLAAIVAADVVGYSRLMEVDEAGTVARLKTVQLELIDPAIAKCKGRLIKTMGDGMLIEFQSVTEALRCAVDFQERMARRNRDMPASRALLYRIGVNLGDVIVDESDIFGDGVNVAARLESIAEPGGICISAAVCDQVGDRPDVTYEDLGEQQVKNINRPIRVYRVLLGRQNAEPGGGPDRHTAPKESAKKPAIAVLPFVNMSGDPEQEFFADGLSEDIITCLVSGSYW
jgi:adenylate cyclase